MALSVGGIGGAYGINMNYVQPMNYSVKNESDISDAFIETGMSGAVMNVPPVIYPVLLVTLGVTVTAWLLTLPFVAVGVPAAPVGIAATVTAPSIM